MGLFSAKYASLTNWTISSLIIYSTSSLLSFRVTSESWYYEHNLRTISIFRSRAAPTQKRTERKQLCLTGEELVNHSRCFVWGSPIGSLEKKYAKTW